MGRPQPGIIAEPKESAFFMVLRLTDRAAHGRRIAGTAAQIPALAKSIAAIDPSAELLCNVGFGPELWDIASPGSRPEKLRPFKPLEAGGRSAPCTGGDLLLHIVSGRADFNFELVLRAMREFGSDVEVIDQAHGFRYLDSRDLTGFIDGTENPSGDEERAVVALVGDEDAEFAGGSYVFTQRYVHDLKKWSAVPVPEQEKVIGRRKPDSEELSATAKLPTAHISRVVIEENGEELEIVRHSFPYGTATEAGLFFIAYTKDLAIPEKMLARMTGASGDGLHDHLMDYTRAVSGATFFAPSLELLHLIGEHE